MSLCCLFVVFVYVLVIVMYQGSDGDMEVVEEGVRTTLNLAQVTEFVADGQWLAETFVVMMLHKTTNLCRSWCEGCKCHGWLNPSKDSRRLSSYALELVSASSVVQQQQPGCAKDDGVSYFCILAGKRSLEISIGDLDVYIEEVSADMLVEITSACCTLPTADLTALIEDYQRGLNFIILEVRLRLGFWKDLPWKAVRLCHPDAETARGYARAMMAEFDSSEQDPQLHHRLTIHLLAKDSALRAELERFAEGTPLQQLPALERWVL